MGMYSAFIDQEIKVLDKNGLSSLKNDDEEYSCVITDEGVDFNEWDSFKIEGYWYPEFVDFLRELAKYIEGYTEFEYEEGYKFRIIFKDKQPYFLREKSVMWEDTMQNLLNGTQEKYEEKNEKA